MARLIQMDEGRVKILSDDVGSLTPEEMNKLVMRCGTVSYQSWGRTKKTPREFIEMIIKRGHFSVLEHSWFSLEVKSLWRSEQRIFLWAMVGYLKTLNSLLVVTQREDKNELVVSGNARMFRDLWTRSLDLPPGNWLVKELSREILSFLVKKNEVLFWGLPEFEQFERNERIFRVEETTFRQDEEFSHRVITILFSDVSRGFTHETVRHRLASFTQASTRYVDYSDFDFVVPPIDSNKLVMFRSQLAGFAMTPHQFVDLMRSWYRALRDKGLPAEMARQFLPVGLATEIVQTMTVENWWHWVRLRGAKTAHPEMRAVAVKTLKELKKRLSDLFLGFQILPLKNGGEYVVVE